MLSIIPLTVYADDSEGVYCQYTGSTTASWGYKPNCTFTVNKIVGDKFKGSFVATNLGSYNLSKQVEGTVYKDINSFTCQFSIPEYYDTWFSILVHPYQGYCQCVTAGNWHFEDFEMTGTKFSYGNDDSELGKDDIDINDVKLCMNLSDAAYDIKNNSEVPDTLKTLLDNIEGYNQNSLKIYNYTVKTNQNDVAFSIISREREDAIDMIVIIRGTYFDEWKGNLQITGDEYKAQSNEHENFNIAKDTIKQDITEYYNNLHKNKPSSNINLIITGHSRGAAVANLYARDAINKQQGYEDSNIPNFSNITAYTFACPNVAHYNSEMENYKGIYNFCFTEDLVSTVPLTNPTLGWDYWKYGKTYNGSLLDDSIKQSQIHKQKEINSTSIEDVHSELTFWPSVRDYYKKPINENVVTTTTLYEFAYDALGVFKTASPGGFFISLANGIFNLDATSKLVPLVYRIKEHISSIGAAHSQETYNNIVSYQIDNGSFFNFFKLYTYQDCLKDQRFLNNLDSDTATYNLDNISYNSLELNTLYSFVNSNENAQILNWNLDDPSTWTGVTWNEDGNVESIDLSFKNLSGSLDLSNFSSLKQLDVTGNNLTSLNLDNCSSLEEMDCSFNKLTALDLSDRTNLTSVTCCYNYLDTHEGSTLYNVLDDLMFSDCYVNYYPQSVPDNATFDSTELNALKTFANINNNNNALNWLDDSGNIDTEKLQNNVLFEYDGSKYRVVAIDISDLDVSGALDLTSLSLLQELYCENTKITTLNIKGCTKLETLKCDGSELTSITLPSNANAKTSSLYDVSCEYNYLDTSIFTQDVIKYVEFKAGGEIQYENQKGDSSALQAAVGYGESLDEADYSKSSFAQLNEILCECKSYDYDNLYLTQADIDSLTADILTKIYNLKAFLNAKISSENGIVKVFYDETELEDSSLSNSGGVIELPPDSEGFTVSDGSDTFSVLFGTTVTLTAIPREGYNFVGWYNSSNNRYISTENPYTFKATANADIKAVFALDGDATLTFLTPSNQVVTTVSKFAAEWAETGTINDLLPDVPFKYGCKNGRWEYNEADVLSKLRNGENVSIVSAYDKGEFTVPSARNAEDKPALDLYYNYDDESGIGSFIMTTGFPENIKVESIGIAYYFKAADSFNPQDYILTLNNKVRTSKFGMDKLYDYYIMNMKNINDRNNWSVRGYVAYYDSNDNLQVEYSNQINIINNIVDRSTVSNDNSATQLPPDEI